MKSVYIVNEEDEVQIRVFLESFMKIEIVV